MNVPLGVGGGRETLRTGESCKKGMPFSLIHAIENSRGRLVVKLVKEVL